MNLYQDLTVNQDLVANRDLVANQDLAPTLNQINDISTRLHEAKEFVQENPNEHKTIAARIYNLPATTLQSSICRG